MQTNQQLNRQYLVAALALLFTLITIFSFAQKQENNPVQVKIVKIVDGDTTTIVKTMEEASVQDFTKQFQNIKGENVQVMITVEGNDVKNGKHASSGSSCQAACKNQGKNNCASSMNFNFNMDSATAHSFSKIFMFNDSAADKNFVWNDSTMKNLPKNFGFNFNFDDMGEMSNFDFDINTDDNGKTVVIKNGGGKTIVINGDDDNANISQSETDNGKTKTKTIVITDDKNKSKKKVIVSTSVVVIDMEDEKSDKKKSKGGQPEEGRESTFNFYPNPSDGNFILDLDLNGKEDAIVRITDLNGKEVYNEIISGTGKTTRTIDLGSNKKGTFIVTTKQGKKTSSKKIIIE